MIVLLVFSFEGMNLLINMIINFLYYSISHVVLMPCNELCISFYFWIDCH